MEVIQIARWLRMTAPTMLLELWEETGVFFGKNVNNNKKHKPMRVRELEWFKTIFILVTEWKTKKTTFSHP